MATLSAVDELNWDYLARIAREHRSLVHSTDPQRALAKFAFSFVEAHPEDRDAVLSNLLLDMTRPPSTKRGNETVVAYLAGILQSDPDLLRKFAKQEGVRLLPG
jgi:hypothetical protein